MLEMQLCLPAYIYCISRYQSGPVCMQNAHELHRCRGPQHGAPSKSCSHETLGRARMLPVPSWLSLILGSPPSPFPNTPKTLPTIIPSRSPSQGSPQLTGTLVEKSFHVVTRIPSYNLGSNSASALL